MFAVLLSGQNKLVYKLMVLVTRLLVYLSYIIKRL